MKGSKGTFLSFSIILLLSIFSFVSCSDNFVTEPSVHPTNTDIIEINVVNLSGNEHKPIAICSGIKIFRNGIIFSSYNKLYSINYDGSAAAQLTNFPDSILGYNISPNGDKIVLSLLYAKKVKLYLINSDGSNFSPVTNSDSVDMEASFSNNSNKIVFRRNWNICIINSDGTELKYLSKHPDSSNYIAPYFIDNDTKILYFEETTSSNYIVHLYDLSTKHDSIMSVLRQRFSDVSSKGEILFVEESNLEEYSIKILNIMNGETREVAKGQYPSFSYDGNRIVYSNGQEIYLIDTNGGNGNMVFKEEEDKKWVSNPKISPDENYIVFETPFPVEVN